MIAALRSELLKLRTRTYVIGVAGMAAFMAVTMLISVGGADNEPSDRGPAGLILARNDLTAADGLARSLGNGVTFLGIAALTIVAINTGTEYTSGTIRGLLVRQPRRVSLLLGKATALATYVVVAVVASSVVGVAAALLFAPGNEVVTEAWWTWEGVQATARGIATLALAIGGWAALGLLLGVALRSAPAAIGVGVAYALPVETLLAEAVPDVVTWLPGQLFQAVARGGTPWLDLTPAVARSFGWTVVALAVGAALFTRRDVAE